MEKFKEGDKVTVIKSDWNDPITEKLIGKTGIVVGNYDDCFKVVFENGSCRCHVDELKQVLMAVGSIVECIDASEINPNGNCIIPKTGWFYTVSGIIEKPRGTGVYLKECDDLILVDYGYKRKIELAPFLQSRFIEVDPAMKIVVEHTNKIAEAGNIHLDKLLDQFEDRLYVQMLELKYGVGHVDSVLHSFVAELTRTGEIDVAW